MFDARKVSGMRLLFESLLRSNFRCGRMLYSRADRLAGRCIAPIVSAE